MVVINSITASFVSYIGGVDTIYNILSLLFVFTVIYIFYKITT